MGWVEWELVKVNDELGGGIVIIVIGIGRVIVGLVNHNLSTSGTHRPLVNGNSAFGGEWATWGNNAVLGRDNGAVQLPIKEPVDGIAQCVGINAEHWIIH